MRKLYEEQLGDVLWEVEHARTKRPYKRVVVKGKTRKKKRTNGRPMTHAAKVAGWNKAAVPFMQQRQQSLNIRKTSITLGEAEQIDANSRAAAKRTAGKRLTPVDNLIGADFGLLLVWVLSSGGGQVKKYHCLCACGKPFEVSVGALLNGRKKDCGCRLKAKRRQQRCRKRQKLARQGRKRAPWKRHWGLAA
jgi:hypothetical protein